MPRKKMPASRVDPPHADAPSPHAAAWAKLTWDDLDQAFGSRSVKRGRSYQRGGHVKNLAVADDGRLLAAVQGTRRYITSARLDAKKKSRDRIEGTCSCPVGNQCKHAVAVIAEYLAQIAVGKSPAAAAADDPRWARLAESSAGDEYAYHDGYEDDEADDDWEDNEWEVTGDEAPSRSPGTASGGCSRRSARGASAKPRATKSTAKAPRRTPAEWDALIKADIEKKSAAELARFVLALVNRFPELRQEFRERILLGEGDAPRLIAEARKELRSVSSEIGWQNHWQHEGHTPDYSRLMHRLERLAELGQADAVVDLGRELFERGLAQVGQAHDEGETGMAMAECFPVVFAAVAASSLPPAEQILYAIDACELDDWDYVGEPAAKILDARWTRADWSAVADALALRLNPAPDRRKHSEASDDGEDEDDSGDNWSRNYRRDSLSAWLVHALEQAGRDDEVLPLYEAEVRRTGSYQRLVNYLIQHKRFDDAERWAREGIEQTREKLPGIASDLADKLVDLARNRKQWDIVAARAACEFFRHPNVKSLQDLAEAAEKANCGAQVRRRALSFLETGLAPIRCEAAPVQAAKTAKAAPKKKGGKPGKKALAAAAEPTQAVLGFVREDDWPLPLPNYLAAAFLFPPGPYDRQRKHLDVLMDLAIAEKKSDEALRWYDQIVADEKAKSGGAACSIPWYSAATLAARVAAAVAKSHPERALEVYRRELDAHLPHANQGAYDSAAACLRKMRPIMQSLDRDDFWIELVKDIREKYRNRPRFMEALDKLERRPIVTTQKRGK